MSYVWVIGQERKKAYKVQGAYVIEYKIDNDVRYSLRSKCWIDNKLVEVVMGDFHFKTSAVEQVENIKERMGKGDDIYLVTKFEVAKKGEQEMRLKGLANYYEQKGLPGLH